MAPEVADRVSGAMEEVKVTIARFISILHRLANRGNVQAEELVVHFTFNAFYV